MKHLLNGVAIAALLAIGAPAWAQNNPSTAPAAAPPAAPAPAAPAPMAKKPMMHHHMAMRHHHMRHEANAGDQMTEQLNREELARIQGGGAPPPPAGAEGPSGPPPSGQMPGPRPSGH